MDTPPKISDLPVRLPDEVRPAPTPALLPDLPSRSAEPGEGRPIHGLSALILVAVDSLWAVFDWLPPIWIVAIPLCFAAVFIPTFLIQKHLKRDSTGRALAFACVLAVLAALPTPITGTPIGLALLAWTGIGGVLDRFRLRR